MTVPKKSDLDSIIYGLKQMPKDPAGISLLAMTAVCAVGLGTNVVADMYNKSLAEEAANHTEVQQETIQAPTSKQPVDPWADAMGYTQTLNISVPDRTGDGVSEQKTIDEPYAPKPLYLTLVKPEPTPAKTGPAPVKTEPVPAKPKLTLVKPEPAPVKAEPEPVNPKPKAAAPAGDCGQTEFDTLFKDMVEEGHTESKNPKYNRTDGFSMQNVINFFYRLGTRADNDDSNDYTGGKAKPGQWKMANDYAKKTTGYSLSRLAKDRAGEATKMIFKKAVECAEKAKAKAKDMKKPKPKPEQKVQKTADQTASPYHGPGLVDQLSLDELPHLRAILLKMYQPQTVVKGKVTLEDRCFAVGDTEYECKPKANPLKENVRFFGDYKPEPQADPLKKNVQFFGDQDIKPCEANPLKKNVRFFEGYDDKVCQADPSKKNVRFFTEDYSRFLTRVNKSVDQPTKANDNSYAKPEQKTEQKYQKPAPAQKPAAAPVKTDAKKAPAPMKLPAAKPVDSNYQNKTEKRTGVRKNVTLDDPEGVLVPFTGKDQVSYNGSAENKYTSAGVSYASVLDAYANPSGHRVSDLKKFCGLDEVLNEMPEYRGMRSQAKAEQMQERIQYAAQSRAEGKSNAQIVEGLRENYGMGSASTVRRYLQRADEQNQALEQKLAA